MTSALRAFHTAFHAAVVAALPTTTVTLNPSPKGSSDYVYLAGPTEARNDQDSHKDTDANELTYGLTVWSSSALTAMDKVKAITDRITSRTTKFTITGFTVIRSKLDGPTLSRYDPDAKGGTFFGQTARYRITAYET